MAALAVALGDARAGEAADAHGDADAEASADADAGSRLLFVPYPITEPAIGNGLLAGLVWLRAGPKTAQGPSLPQAYGFGALWTSGGSRGLVVFDARAWDEEARWRTTAVAARADLKLTFTGLAPGGDASVGFTLRASGGGLEAERKLGDGPNSVAIAVTAVNTEAEFRAALPSELVRARTRQNVTGVKLTWSQDTRDDVFSPSSGHYLAASIDSGFAVKWMDYRPALGNGVLGLRARFEASVGDEAFYLRPYVSLRGVPALRYAGEQVGELEAEFRYPLNGRWDVVAFAGLGASRADFHGISGRQSVTTGGVGIRFKPPKLFGLTFGLDVAQGPDGRFVYIQIGNPWSK